MATDDCYNELAKNHKHSASVLAAANMCESITEYPAERDDTPELAKHQLSNLKR